MKKVNILISDRIKEIRTYHGYSQKEIANILNISRATYADYENNRRLIPLRYLNALSNFYGKSIDYLLGLTEEISTTKKNDLKINKISQNLKTVRKDLNLTLTLFATSLNYGISTISEYENGKNIVSTSFCYDLAKKYNISIDWLLNKSTKKYIDSNN